MARHEKHGQYDRERKLPDNRMIPTGSGTDVWLNQRVIELLGESDGRALIAQSVPHKTERYKWLCEQLAQRGYPAITEEYHQKQKDAAAAGRLREKQRQLENWKEQLGEEHSCSSRYKYIQREIARAERYIHERTEADGAKNRLS